MDDELAIDVLAQLILLERLAETGLVAQASCESDEVLRALGPEQPHPECRSVSLSPLDDSSVLDTNVAVGSIFGV